METYRQKGWRMKIKDIFKQTGKFRQDTLQELQQRYDAEKDPAKKEKIKKEMMEFAKGFSKFERN